MADSLSTPSAEVIHTKKSIPRIWIAVFALCALVNVYLSRFLLSYGADGIQYVEIARHYADMDWHAAINAYWGPLVSWLMAPLIALGVDPYMAFKIERAFTAVIFFAVWMRALERLRLSLFGRQLALIAGAVIGLQWMLHETPDLLWATLLLGWLLLLTSRAYLGKSWVAVAAGLTGAALYLTKSFGLPFVLTNLVAILIWRIWWHGDIAKAYKLLGRGSITMATFLMAIVPWLLAITVKYDQTLIGTAGAYNKLMLGPENTPPDLIRTGFVLPTFSGELEAPADSLACCSWEEPWKVAKAAGLQDWRIASEQSHFLGNLYRNFSALAYNDALFLLGLLAIILAFWTWRSKSWKRRDFAVSLLFMLTLLNMVCGYLLILVQDRYLWGGEALLVLTLFLMADRLHQRLRYPTAWLPSAVVLLAVVFLQTVSIRDAYGPGNQHQDEFGMRAAIASQFGSRDFSGSRWAVVGDARPGTYRRGALVACQSGGQFYGLLDREHPKYYIQSELEDFSIDFLMLEPEHSLASQLMVDPAWEEFLNVSSWVVFEKVPQP